MLALVFMLISRLTQKFQATVPKEIRRLLELKAGDSIVFEVDGPRVLVRRANPIDIQFVRSLSSTLSEWNSQFDEDAYRDL